MIAKQKLVIAITGASGSIYAKRLLHYLALASQNIELEVGIVVSDNAQIVWQQELNELPQFVFPVFSSQDFFAPFASGSARYQQMVIVPCSMGTLGRIAHGISDSLITRAADVMLKEHRKLICVIRETPLNLIHIKNMKLITSAGGLILPAVPSFYTNPQTIEQLIDTVVFRILDQLSIPHNGLRWGDILQP